MRRWAAGASRGILPAIRVPSASPARRPRQPEAPVLQGYRAELPGSTGEIDLLEPVEDAPGGRLAVEELVRGALELVPDDAYQETRTVFINVTAVPNPPSGAWMNLTVTAVSQGSPDRTSGFLAEVVMPPDFVPPQTRIKALEGYQTEARFLVEWEIVSDQMDTADFFIEYQVNNGSGFGSWQEWGIFTNLSARFPGEHGNLDYFGHNRTTAKRG